MIKPFMNSEEMLWNKKELQLKTVRPGSPRSRCRSPGPGQGAGPGRPVGDDVVIQLADPGMIQWIIGTGRADYKEAEQIRLRSSASSARPT